MNNDELDNQLIAKYRTEFYETDDIDLKEDKITDEDLKRIIYLNNRDMSLLLMKASSKTPLNIELMRRLFIATLNFCILAQERKISIPGRSFLCTMATTVGYPLEKVYSKLNVGSYIRIVDPERVAKSRKPR